MALPKKHGKSGKVTEKFDKRAAGGKGAGFESKEPPKRRGGEPRSPSTCGASKLLAEPGPLWRVWQKLSTVSAARNGCLSPKILRLSEQVGR